MVRRDQRRDWLESQRRAGILDHVRATYAGYASVGRDALWSAANPGYARLASDHRSRLLADLAASVADAGARVIDLGCGDGRTAELALGGGLQLEWTGVDLLEERVERARARALNARFLATSADDLPFGDASFDVAVASTLFSSLPSDELEQAVAAEIARVLRPDGWLVWYDVRYANPMNPAVHGLSRHRIARLFPGWVGELRAVGLIPALARRLGRATPMLYPTLAVLRPLRSHLAGRLHRPPAS
ncbi:MAG: class I SAM-dependent methyltransferase [Candidatus Limnocylindria bacterium]